jgi:hypothetical protein
MKAKLVTSLTALFAGAGLALAQTPPSSPYRLIDHSGSGNVSQASALEPVRDTIPANRPTLSLAPIAGYGGTEPAPQAPAPGCKDAFDSHHVEPCNRFWASAEYLVWWTKSSRVPPLAATAPAQFAGRDIPADQLTPIFGGTHLDFQAYSGARFSAGYMLDDEGSLGIDANYFFTETRVKRFIGGSTGDPLLGPTFFDLGNNLETIVADADPGRFRGVVSVEAPSRFWGTEANVSVGIQPVFSDRLRLFAGFRYFELSEALTRVDQATGVGDNAGVVITGLDHFGTRNQFYGGQIGFAAHSHMGVNWTFDVIGKFAMGGVREFINIDGASTLIQPGQPITLGNGNLLALGTNSGHFRKSKFAVLPELTVNLGYRITSHLNAFMGYNLLYLDKVARPADQIDFGVNTSQITFLAGSPGVLSGAPRPAPLLHSDSFWAQGMNFGLEFSY